jgi:hypothetical protein
MPHQLQIRLMRQFLWRQVIPIQMNHVHILQISELPGHYSARLPALDSNLLPFRECHASHLALISTAKQWPNGDTLDPSSV